VADRLSVRGRPKSQFFTTSTFRFDRTKHPHPELGDVPDGLTAKQVGLYYFYQVIQMATLK